MVRTINGTHLRLRCFIPHGDTLQEQIDTLHQLQTAERSGDYSELLAKARLLEAHSDQRRMRFDDQQPLPFGDFALRERDDDVPEPDAVRTPEGYVIDEGLNDPAVPRRKRG